MSSFVSYYNLCAINILRKRAVIHVEQREYWDLYAKQKYEPLGHILNYIIYMYWVQTSLKYIKSVQCTYYIYVFMFCTNIYSLYNTQEAVLPEAPIKGIFILLHTFSWGVLINVLKSRQIVFYCSCFIYVF